MYLEIGENIKVDSEKRIGKVTKPFCTPIEVPTASLVKEFGTDDVERYAEYYRANFDYLVPEGRGRFIVDADAKSIAIANRNIEILERAVTLLEKGKDTARARRILTRYTDKAFGTPAAWRAWLSDAKSSLFFTDVGGFRFYDKRPLMASMRSRILESSAPAAGDGKVAVSISVVPKRAAPGDTVTVAVRFKIADGWHTYARVPKSSPYPTTALK